MAENEIVDIARARRWKPIRDLLAKPGVSLEEIADCVEQQLSGYLQKGLRAADLLSILKAASIDNRALRVAVANCRHQELARFVRDAIKTSDSVDPRVVSVRIMSLISKRLEDALCLCGSRTSNFESAHENARLRIALRNRLMACSRTMALGIQREFTGEKALPRIAPAHPRQRIHSATSLLDRTLEHGRD